MRERTRDGGRERASINTLTENIKLLLLFNANVHARVHVCVHTLVKTS